MHKGTAFALVTAAIVGGFAVGRLTSSPRETAGETAGGRALDNVGAAIAGDVERKKVPLGGPSKGPADAIVNIVEFSDFQCPFCTRVLPTLKRLAQEYPKDVRVFFRHLPLPFHQDAPLAAQASMAADAQGKFWEMHDKLFENQKALDRASLDRYAQEIGLDVAKFKADLDSGKYKAKVDEDLALSQKIGVQGTPNFFVNGRPLQGAQPYEAFKKLIDDELGRTKKLVAAGTARSKVYDKLMAGAVAAPGAAPAAAKPEAPAAADVFKVEVGNAPIKGSKAPKITIVEFSEFQCPFCSRANPTLQQVLDTYKDDVQIAFKHYPLPFHNNARIAAQASEAAKAQGKFWEMHDKLFANQSALDRPSLDKYAQEIGLDMKKFAAFLDGNKGEAQVAADEKQAGSFGVTGTPTFFVNGRQLVGAQPFGEFKAVIDQELKKADDKLKAGVARKDLYAALVKDGKTEVAAPAPAAPSPAAPAAGTVYKAEIAGAPSKGPKDALVTIVQYSDFECPFCSRVEPTVDQIMEHYKGKVRVVWRDYPLPFHQNAVPAAAAARAAGEQGKFWEMHKKIFENQRAIDRASLEKYAQELGLNVKKFTATLDSKKFEAAIQADMAAGQKIGVQGTPAFFINGVAFLEGAAPFDNFKRVIDAQLAKAEELVKTGTPKAKVYDTIMKGAVAQAGGGAAPGGADAAPLPAERKEIEIGNAPTRGPKNAPVTLVVFSDFECPFCSRVEPTYAELERQYPGKIKVVWKNFPLGFHQNAKPAAVAALAAGQQGKFWQMHEKLFANQRALDRASLDKYAKEIGLDMTKFAKAMEDPALGAAVDADASQGQAVGVQGTPATFVNGRFLSGAVPIDQFKRLIDDELAAEKPMANKAKKGRRS